VEEAKPSATALLCAMLRAAHLLWDQPPQIFEDTLALQLSGCESEAALKAQMDQLDAEVARTTNPDFALTLRRSMTAQLVTRGRYLEDEVDQAVRRGVSQYVILGAGLDSFAYRRPELAKVLHIFEVDHPATQAWKRTRLRAAGVELPANLSLVPVDFERESR
jgi:methyltransferase (TIGR00027 family)